MKYEVVGIDHIFICPKDWKKSMGFWRDTLELKVQDDWSDREYHGAAMTLGESRVTLAEPEESRDKEVGFRVEQGRPYVYLRVTGLDALLERLKKEGVEILSGPVALHWGPRLVSVRDPDGIAVMLVEWAG